MQIGVATARDRKVTYIYANERKREKEKLPFAVCSTPKDERCIRLNTTDLTTSLFYKKKKKISLKKGKDKSYHPLPPIPTIPPPPTHPIHLHARTRLCPTSVRRQQADRCKYEQRAVSTD